MSSPWLQLAQLAEQLAHQPSKLKKRAAIAEAIAAAYSAAPKSNDAALFALYLAGSPFAESDPRKLSTGGALLSKAVLAVSGATNEALTAAYRRHGDLGTAAFDLFASSREPSQAAFPPTPPLTLSDVSQAFSEISAARTTVARAARVEDLLRRATPLEVKYLLKLMLGDMRIGVKQSLVEEAIAHATSVPVTQVRHAVMLEADLGSAVHRAFGGTLAEARMSLFHPLGFMLASPVDSPEEAIARFTTEPRPGPIDAQPEQEEIGENRRKPVSSITPPQHIAAFLEDKYDGMRAQLHCGDPAHPGRVAIYSRSREDITESFPELCEAFAHVKPASDGPLILDGEILAWNYANYTALPFATLGERIGRKRVSDELRTRVPVIFMAFDLLYAGDSLTLDLPLRTRRNRLEAIVEHLAERIVSPLIPSLEEPAQSTLFATHSASLAPDPSLPRLILSPSRLVKSADDIDRAYAAARARSNEGVMIKAADSVYQPGRRGLAWVKLKRELATLDVVITAAEYGHGKRAGLLSDYTFAVRGEHPSELLNVGKAYSGVTDAEIAELTDFLKAHTLEDHGHFRTVEPLIVLEVAFNNIMRSTRHASGFALRFPRILRLRLDKPIAEIDTLARVEEIYQSQIDKPAKE
jgi:DNA ligase-1